MSGSNRLINSSNTLEGGSQDELTTKLEDGNEEAISIIEGGIGEEDAVSI